MKAAASSSVRQPIRRTGILDMCIWGDVSKWDFFKMFPYAYSGNHLKFNEIDAKQADVVDVQLDEPCWVHTDGEVNACRRMYRCAWQKTICSI
jgi:diacylglycerol kinase family enzyme